MQVDFLVYNFALIARTLSEISLLVLKTVIYNYDCTVLDSQNVENFTNNYFTSKDTAGKTICWNIFLNRDFSRNTWNLSIPSTALCPYKAVLHSFFPQLERPHRMHEWLEQCFWEVGFILINWKETVTCSITMLVVTIRCSLHVLSRPLWREVRNTHHFVCNLRQHWVLLSIITCQLALLSISACCRNTGVVKCFLFSLIGNRYWFFSVIYIRYTCAQQLSTGAHT